MRLSTNNFLSLIRQIVTGGGRHADGSLYHDSGFLKRAEGVNLSQLLVPPTDSGGGTNLNTIAATVGVSQISFNVDFVAGPMAGTSAADLVTDFVPGFKFKLLALDFVTTVAGVGAGATQTAHLDIGANAVTAGTCVITAASTATVGGLTAGAAITGASTGSATAAISVAIGAGGTAFTAGHGELIVTIQNMDTADAFAAVVAGAAGVADETNARVLKVEETVDTIGNLRWQVPRDFDEASDTVRVRVLASLLTLTTDDDVELDSKVYIKKAATALGADVDPTAPGTVLAAAEQWIEFDLSGNSLVRDDIVTFNLITNGANDTAGEEVLIHEIEVVYASCLVSYDNENDAEGNPLR